MLIHFETHSTSEDNGLGCASSHYDVDLSPSGVLQALDLGARYPQIETVYCSDLRRSQRTAELAFATTRCRVVPDPRLRECHYGELTRSQAEQIEVVRIQYVCKPFPNGESYQDVSRRVADFLMELPPRDTLIIGHRATWYSLEHLLNGLPLQHAVARPFVWQPGWSYSCDILKA